MSIKIKTKKTRWVYALWNTYGPMDQAYIRCCYSSSKKANNVLDDLRKYWKKNNIFAHGWVQQFIVD